ncbi:uncharacterized protein LOC124928155 [Impatiens glandulifera]|uniref:uncharacterized protein LOC124928155 n=1 Tax=Impatiens glandulifera TaxID=253017 RepID=UPI001FB0CD82|nr:uncharacterized protein LOC124928155 [Impatiens glandulifera]
MGTKRSCEEELTEFSYKQPKLVSSFAESYHSSFAESYPCRVAAHDADVIDNRYNSPIHKELEEDSKCTVSDSFGKLLDPNSSSPSEEDYGSGSGVTICSSLCPPYFDHYSPNGEGPSTYSCDDDKHSSILDAPPRKHIPLGPNHQATLPAWNPRPLMGNKTGIIDLSVDDGFKVGEGRKDCYCYDAGSVSCVQKHIKEASDKLLEVVGSEKFEQLGFYEMGEEVALNWTDEEEDIFHDVVYANPASHDKNFWKHLSIAFPYRTKKEIVSYYFNVFILRRRAAQNRSNNLGIDSDSDEWQGIIDEYIAIDDNDDEDNTSIGISIDCKSESVAKDVKKQHHASLESRYNNFESWNGSAEENGYLLEVFDDPVRVWEDGMKGVDLLLPTSNVMEEIFGEESNSKSV